MEADRREADPMDTSIAGGLRNHLTRMAARWRAWARDERGVVTVIVALSMAGLIALLSLGIDLGALYTARSEAQRAADAAALAGASAFLEFGQDQARSVAVDRAITYATSNTIQGIPIAPEDVSVTVNVDSSTVWAQVRRNDVPTWFARLFGIESVDVGAEATAWAGAAGAAQCLKPFAIPDMWHETTDDLNGNRIWDEGERWHFDPDEGDRYVPYSGPGGGSNETGYGSHWRDGYSDASGRTYGADYGRRITVKTTDPHQTVVPSFFLPWVLPADPNQAVCGATGPGNGGTGGGDGGDGGDDGGTGGPGGGGDQPGNGQGDGWDHWNERRGGLGAGQGNGGGTGGGGGTGALGGTGGGGNGTAQPPGRGAARYRQNICSCNASIIDLDSEYEIEPGNMVGPTYQGVQRLIDQDPDAYWDDRTNTVISAYGMNSPRVITVAMFDPAEISKPGRQDIRFNNFARVFIEEQASPQAPVTGRMLYYVPGLGVGAQNGATTGSLVRVLQLIR
jgi:Flp pilus assembly protein TadG